MARLKKEVQTYIVRSLAQFNTPQETATLVKEEFGIDVTRQQCEAYDPTKRIGKDLSQILKKEFEETRKIYLDAPKNIPIANQTVRLEVYQRLINKAKSPVMALKILKQAAEEMNEPYAGLNRSSAAMLSLSVRPMRLPSVILNSASAVAP